jgi:hypothetical protein
MAILMGHGEWGVGWEEAVRTTIHMMLNGLILAISNLSEM